MLAEEAAEASRAACSCAASAGRKPASPGRGTCAPQAMAADSNTARLDTIRPDGRGAIGHDSRLTRVNYYHRTSGERASPQVRTNCRRRQARSDTIHEGQESVSTLYTRC